MLSDIEIEKLARELAIAGRPLICPFQRKNLGPVSYDIETTIQDWKHDIARLVSMEHFILPRNVAGIVGLRSRAVIQDEVYASFSPLVDPGFSGKLTFIVYHLNETFNYKDIFQMMFFKVDGEVGTAYNERKSSTAMGRTGFDKQ